MNKSNIEWTDFTWNPVTGCSKVSAGCKNCYAEAVMARFEPDRKFTDVRCHEDRLDQPLKRKKPARIFVNSMSDLFHEKVPFEFIDKVFAVMALCPQHTFQILTKRPERMVEYFQINRSPRGVLTDVLCSVYANNPEIARIHPLTGERAVAVAERGWPLPNSWLGVSVEDQPTADLRIPQLLDCPAVARFVSYEPALGPVDLRWHFYGPTGNFRTYKGERQFENKLTPDAIRWVIVGGESGPGARPMDLQWARDVRDQCHEAGVPFFFKQIDKKQPIPDDLMVRQFPEVG